jgi:hypothetical protein
MLDAQFSDFLGIEFIRRIWVSRIWFCYSVNSGRDSHGFSTLQSLNHCLALFKTSYRFWSCGVEFLLFSFKRFLDRPLTSRCSTFS